MDEGKASESSPSGQAVSEQEVLGTRIMRMVQEAKCTASEAADRVMEHDLAMRIDQRVWNGKAQI